MSYVRRARRGDEAQPRDRRATWRAGSWSFARRARPIGAGATAFRGRRGRGSSLDSRRTSSARRSRRTPCWTPTRLGLGDEFLSPAVSAGEYIAKELYWNDGGTAGIRVSAAGHPGADTQRQLPRRCAAVPAGEAHRREGRIWTPRWRSPGTRPPASARTARGRTASARHSSGWTTSTPATTSAPCSRSRRPRHRRVRARALKGLRLLPGALLHGERRAEVLPRPHLSDRHPLRGAEPDHALQLSAGSTRALDLLAQSVLAWAMEHMWDERGLLLLPGAAGLTIRTSYMRWSQAWMLLALTVMADGAEEMVA